MKDVLDVFKKNGFMNLFTDELSDMLSAEKQLIDALPKMSKAADSRQLKAALDTHLKETKEQHENLLQVFKILDIKPAHEKCEAMEGLVKEGKEIIKHYKEGPVRDAGLICIAQKVEHYEMASYGTLVAHAKLLKFNNVVSILKTILEQESKADEKLNAIAEQGVNEQALAS